MVLLILRNGFKYEGEIIWEDPEKICIQDIKLGKIEIAKPAIMMRSENGGGRHDF